MSRKSAERKSCKAQTTQSRLANNRQITTKKRSETLERIRPIRNIKGDTSRTTAHKCV